MISQLSDLFFRRLRRNQMILANTLFQCVCYHPEEFQIITSGTDRKVRVGTLLVQEKSLVPRGHGCRLWSHATPRHTNLEDGSAGDPLSHFGNAALLSWVPLLHCLQNGRDDNADLMDYSHGLQLDFNPPFSRGSSQPRDQTQVSCITGRFFTS